MISFKRRQLVAGMGAAFAAGSIGSAARAAMGPDDKFDLVIKGGEVLDPSQGLRGKRDIGMRFGKIEALEADIPAARAMRVHERRGTHGGAGPHRPALARLPQRHRHSGRRAGAVPGHHHHGLRGRRGREHLRRLPALHDGAVAHAASTPSCTSPTSACRRSRSASCSTSTSPRPKPRRRRSRRTPTSPSASRCACRRTSSRRHGIEPLKRAIRACEIAGTGGRVMCHIGGVETPELMCADPARRCARATSSRTATRARRTTTASSPTSCRTASCCPRRSRPRSAAWCSTSATAAAASTTRWPRRRSRRAARPTPSPPTSTCSRATRPASPTSPG